MESFWQEALRSAPTLTIFSGLMAYITHKFMKYLEFRDRLIQDIVTDVNKNQERTIEVINKNSEMLGKVKETLHHMNNRKVGI